jgi:Cu2+-exporting ATPase
VRADALDRLARVTDLVFDKTGTLSDARPVLADVATFAGFDCVHALRIAAALERDSGHPLAAAFTHATHPSLTARHVATIPGCGIEGMVDGVHWRLGHAPFATGSQDDGALWLGDGQRAVARFIVTESPRADAPAAIAALRALGIELHLSSGDAVDAVARFAATLDLRNVGARRTPEAKLAGVRALQQTGRVVAMVGDGLNDAPVLAGADVSIAIGDGAAMAQRAADLVLAAPALLRVPEAIALARRTRRIVQQNLAWAIGYNLLALPLAAAGWVTPWVAALGMALSSLTVTLNALRLARAAPAPGTQTAMLHAREVRA